MNSARFILIAIVLQGGSNLLALSGAHTADALLMRTLLILCILLPTLPTPSPRPPPPTLPRAGEAKSFLVLGQEQVLPQGLWDPLAEDHLAQVVPGAVHCIGGVCVCVCACRVQLSPT